jgi:hypothetical protein
MSPWFEIVVDETASSFELAAEFLVDRNPVQPLHDVGHFAIDRTIAERRGASRFG